MIDESPAHPDEPIDLVIVGAGAAGLAAGIFAAQSAKSLGKSHQILLLDGAKTIGAKILVSGGGRCNVTHDEIHIDDFNGSRNIVRNVLKAFDEKAAMDWFMEMGVELKREVTGKLFPVSDSARTVLEALLGRLNDLGVRVLPEHRVSKISILHDEVQPMFEIAHNHGTVWARRIILATGGRSLPRTGSDGLGWAIVRQLGHSVTDTYPALVPLMLDDRFFHAEISGLSHPAELSVWLDGKRIDRRTDSLLWTHFGISGPVVMDASRHWVIARASSPSAKVEMRCNFLPGEDFESIDKRLLAMTTARPRAGMGKIVSELFPERLALALLRHTETDPATVAAQFSRDARRRLSHALTALPLPITRDRGWNYAEVTAGGVPLDEIDFRTMESRKVPGLYLVGEILDCDGRIGGFNFQWAWATGFIAGNATARKGGDSAQ